MSIERESNPSLSNFKMVQRKHNWIDYVPKGSDKNSLDFMDASILDTLESLKKIYQFEAKKEDDDRTSFASRSDERQKQSDN